MVVVPWRAIGSAVGSEVAEGLSGSDLDLAVVAAPLAKMAVLVVAEPKIYLMGSTLGA